MKVVESISLQENEIANLEGLSDTPELTNLNLANNKLESLSTLQAINSLKVLNLDGNPIAKVEDLVALNKLKNLQEISMVGCAIADEKGDDFRKELIIACELQLGVLKKINGEPITDEEIQEAMTLKEERIQEALKKPEGEENQEEINNEED